MTNRGLEGASIDFFWVVFLEDVRKRVPRQNGITCRPAACQSLVNCCSMAFLMVFSPCLHTLTTSKGAMLSGVYRRGNTSANVCSLCSSYSESNETSPDTSISL